ncbi:MAG: hypothetical protein LBD05_01425 [Mycoplasmataceae bacterium]|nr:hypothetical protein [Mycoplasmataceae bacterium]
MSFSHKEKKIIEKFKKSLINAPPYDANAEKVLTDAEKKVEYLRFLYYWLFHVASQNATHKSLLKKIHVLNYSVPGTIPFSLTKTELLYSIAFCERWITYYKHKFAVLSLREINKIHFKQHNHYLKQFINLHAELLKWLSNAMKFKKQLANAKLSSPKIKETLLPEEFKIPKNEYNNVNTENIDTNDIENEIKTFENDDEAVQQNEMEEIFDELEEQFDEFQETQTITTAKEKKDVVHIVNNEEDEFNEEEEEEYDNSEEETIEILDEDEEQN